MASIKYDKNRTVDSTQKNNKKGRVVGQNSGLMYCTAILVLSEVETSAFSPSGRVRA